jgi:hypothetical protein
VLDATDQTIAALARIDKDRIGVCLDLANLACTWEDPAQTLERLAGAGITVVRAQVAAAIEVADPVEAAETLREYVQAGQQHQVTNPAGAYVDDLSGALRDLPPGPWRVRYHVPLHTAPAPPLVATTDVWRSALRHLMGGAVPGTEYLDVDTETWDARSPKERPGGSAAPAQGAADQVAYTRNELESLGLSPPAEACAA